jgi:hypothetical protein
MGTQDGHNTGLHTCVQDTLPPGDADAAATDHSLLSTEAAQQQGKRKCQNQYTCWPKVSSLFHSNINACQQSCCSKMHTTTLQNSRYLWQSNCGQNAPQKLTLSESRLVHTPDNIRNTVWHCC